MPRQVLTIIVIVFGFLLIMKGCPSKDGLPPAVQTESVPPLGDEAVYTLRSADESLTVRLALDGSLVDAKTKEREIVRLVSRSRRAFTLVARHADGRRQVFPGSGWTNREIEGGREFTFSSDVMSVTKRVVLADDGSGLSVTLDAAGLPEHVRGFDLTGSSGPRLSGSEDRLVSGALWQSKDEKAAFFAFGSLVQERERRRAGQARRQADGDAVLSPMYYRRKPLRPDEVVERFGVLGADYYVALESLPDTAALNVDAYRSRRGDEQRESDEIETWVSLDATNGAYEGEFALRWSPRAEAPPVLDETEEQEERSYTLENDSYRAVFTDRGAALRSLDLKRYSTVAGEEPAPENWIPILRDGVRPGERALTLLADHARFGLDCSQRVWQAEVIEEGRAIRFRLETPTSWILEKTVRLPEDDAYWLDVGLRITRPGSGAEPSVKYTLIGPAGSYIEDSYRGITAAEPPNGILLERRGGDNESWRLDDLEGASEPMAHYYQEGHARGVLRAVAVRGAFFVVALVTEERLDEEGRPAGTVTEARLSAIKLEHAVERPDGESSRTSLRGQVSCVADFGDRDTVEAHYSLYAGPGIREELRPLEIEAAVDYGFFGFIGRGLMWLMKLLQRMAGSYGVAIMIMTLIVRGLLLPVSYRMQLGMQRYSQRIQKIKPLLDEISKKYANNKQKMNQERMRIMREHKVGFPLGCLTIFLQLPIWFALFQALRVEFSLRHQSFLWATDLSMPDQLFPLPFFQGVPFLPEYFNLLPILMLVLWVLQQKATPQPGAGDPQVQMQMKMIRFMPYVFFLFLYNYAAALALYMCVSSAWGIAEGKLVRRAIKRAS